MSDEPDAAGPGAGEPPPPPAEPRLRIHHLMLWTALSAVLLVVMQTRRITENYPPVYAWVAWMGPIAVAVALLVLGLRLVWRKNGVKWLAAPGHGVALLMAIQWAFYAPYSIAYALFLTRGDDGSWSFDPAFFTGLWGLTMYLPRVAGLVTGVWSLVLAWRLADTRLWRGYFVARPLFGLAGFLFNTFVLSRLVVADVQWWIDSGWYYVLYQVPSAAGIVLLVVACVADGHRPRHWTHCWGVLAVVVPAIGQWIATVVGLATGGFATS